MLVTLNTDASFWYGVNKGAYAFWAKSNEFCIKKTGVFRQKCLCNTDAEAKAILNGLSTVCNASTFVTRIIVNTDSIPAIAIFQRCKMVTAKDLAEWKWSHIYKVYMALLLRDNLTIEFRHVKAHNGTSDKRSFVNDWCDKNAKKSIKSKNKVYEN